MKDVLNNTSNYCVNQQQSTSYYRQSASFNRRRLLLLPILLLLTGCIGLAVPLPYTAVSKKNISHDVDYKDFTELPREVRETESVFKDKSRSVIEYRTIGRCYLQILIVPVSEKGCERIETWDYSQQDLVTVKVHSHHLFGFWCSPIPYVSIIVLAETGTSPVMSRFFPFCEIQFGQTMNIYQNNWIGI